MAEEPTSTGARRRGESVAKRFWSKVAKRGADDCWLWRAGLTASGYGRFRFGGRSSPMVGAHRLAWELTHGPIGDSAKFVCHRCDVPRCCNPAHLFLGSHADNMADMAAKGRACVDQLGSKGHNAKLTEADITFIRTEIAWGRANQKDMAECFHMSRGSVCDIVNAKTWTHVPDPAPAIRAERKEADAVSLKRLTENFATAAADFDPAAWMASIRKGAA